MPASRRLLAASGDRAPDFSLAGLSGGRAALADLMESGLTASGPVVLAFFKISCPVCQMTFPLLERIHRTGALQIVGVSQNDAEATREFNEAFGITFPVLLDSAAEGYPASNAYGIGVVPTLFVVERDGTISAVMESFRREELIRLGGLAGMNPIRETETYPAFRAG